MSFWDGPFSVLALGRVEPSSNGLHVFATKRLPLQKHPQKFHAIHPNEPSNDLPTEGIITTSQQKHRTETTCLTTFREEVP